MKKLLDFNGLRYFYSKMKALIDNTADKTNAEIQAIKSKNVTQDGAIKDSKQRLDGVHTEIQAIKSKNVTQDGAIKDSKQRLDGVHTEIQAIKSKNVTQDGAIEDSKRRLNALHTVASSGDYNALKNKPNSLPANGGNAYTVGGIARENLLEHHWDWGTSYKDLNLATKAGMWRAGNATKNLPPNHFGESGDNDFLIFNAGIEPGENGEKWVKQTVYDVRGRGVWRRSRHGGAWEPWEWAWDGSRRNDKKTDNHVTEELRWQQYGDRHTIIDASSGKSLNGTVSFSNSNSTAPWIPGRPMLVGFNGSETWGVKVDTARTADAFHGKPPHEFATLTGAWSNSFAKSDWRTGIAGDGGFRERFDGDTTHPAGVTFHRTGAFAANFGLDTDNYIKVGGFSHGNIAYKIYSERTISVSQATPGAMAEGCMHMTY